MKERINILHVSDLHLTETKIHDQKIVLDAFLDDVRCVVGSALRPDLIVFSGDLVNNADEPNAYNVF